MASSDARPVPRKNTAYRVTFPIFDADGDLVTGATGLDSEVSIDGGTFADVTAEATEIATNSGMYFLDLTSGEMNGDTVAVIIKTTSSGAKTTPIVLYPEEAGDIRADMVQLGGSTQSATDLKDFADDGYDPSTNKVQGVVLTDTVTTYTGNTVQSGDSFARIGATGSGLTTLASQASVDTIDNLVDDLESRLGTPSNLGSGATVAANLVDIEGQTDDIGAAGAGLTALGDARIANLDATVSSRATPAQVNTEVDTAITDARLDELLAADSDIDGAAPPTVGSVFHELMTKTAGSFTYDQTTDSVEAIRDRGDAAWVTGTTPPTVGAIADAVWDETLADHLGVGSTGAGLNAAGAAGDPWSTALPGAYGAGTAGKIVGDNVNATISSRASQASVDTIDDFLDAEVAAILADTNELQIDWANGGRLDLILDARASQVSVDTIDDFVDDLEGRLTLTRAGYLDNLSAGAVALQSSVDSLEAGVIVTDKTGYRLSATGVDDIFDELRAGHSIAGSYGESFFTLVSGAAIVGTLSTTQMSTDLTEATNSHYNGRIIIWITGVLVGQATDITAYDGTTKVLTYTAITEAPAIGDRFIIV